MPNYIRWRRQGAAFFFTLVTYRRRPLFARPQCRDLLSDAINSVRERLPFTILAMVLLPDHLHCVMALPKGDDRFPARFRQIKGRFTHRYLAVGGSDLPVTQQQHDQRRRGVWQARYWEHRIADEADYLRHRDYIHLNPVHHGHAARPGDWPWSSFHRYVRLGWLDPNWPGSGPIDLPDVEE